MNACLKSILLPYLKVKQQIEFKILSPIDKKCVILAYDTTLYFCVIYSTSALFNTNWSNNIAINLPRNTGSFDVLCTLRYTYCESD